MKTESQRAGFTLLELLIVIAMMIFITTIAAVNYFHASRAYSYTTAGNTIFNALQMARQRACIDNKAVYFFLTDTNSFVLQESVGTISSVNAESDPTQPNGKIFYDNYSDASAFASNSVLIDIDQPGSGALVWKAETGTNTIHNGWIDANNNAIDANYSSCVLHVTNNPACDFSKWAVGDHYGVSIFALQLLPKGFTFQQTSPTKIVFMPDGTVDLSALPGGALVVVENISGANHQITFTIAPNGTISQQ